MDHAVSCGRCRIEPRRITQVCRTALSGGFDGRASSSSSSQSGNERGVARGAQTPAAQGEGIHPGAMFDPAAASPSSSWSRTPACENCSFWADNFNGIIVHLNHRDVTMIAVSRAPYAKLAAYQKRMGWAFPGTRRATPTSISITRSRSSPTRSLGKRRSTTTRSKTRSDRARGRQCLLSRSRRPRLPHLLDLCARHRHDESRLSIPRHRAQGLRRGQSRAVLGVPPRRVRPLDRQLVR